MKNKTPILLFFFLGVLSCCGQLSSQKAFATELGNIPQESVYINYNNSLLFSGESLKYKFYCFNNATRKLSLISKIGYVSLIAKDGTSIFNHKIILDFGLGDSDFFIPTSVPTGSYKLVGYTNWMKNEGVSAFFQSDIHIINPYQKLPKDFISRHLDSISQFDRKPIDKIVDPPDAQNESNVLKLSLDKLSAGKREEVRLQIAALNEVAAHGNYSISVHKIDTFPKPSTISSEMFFANFNKGMDGKPPVVKLINRSLPELRGEIISGNIKIKDTGLPAKNQRISLSLPGSNYLHKITVSNDKGEFYFNFDERYDNANAVLQVLSDDWNQFEVNVNQDTPDYGKLVFADFVVPKELEEYILERSVQNQLENAFQEVKSDSVERVIHHPIPFYRKFTTVYDLDDFTRFSGIPETMVEVIDNAATRRLKNGDRVFVIRPNEGLPNNSLLPMVFVDGLFIKKHQDFMDYSAKNIKKISFSRGIYLLGAQAFQGILHFETVEGNFFEDFYRPHVMNVDLFRPQPVKQYFHQTYEKGEEIENAPDFRYQLLWLPNVELSSLNTEISFFTSDVEGHYEVVLDGFDLNGKAITIKREITVE